MGKVAAAFLHMAGRDGRIVTLRPGDHIPDELATHVTNPDAYVEVEHEDEVVVDAPAQDADTHESTSDEPQTAAGDENTAETDDDEAEAENEPETATEPPADETPTDGPAEPIDDLDGLDYDELQERAKTLGLAANGKKAVLVTRIREHLATTAE